MNKYNCSRTNLKDTEAKIVCEKTEVKRKKKKKSLYKNLRITTP